MRTTTPGLVATAPQGQGLEDGGTAVVVVVVVVENGGWWFGWCSSSEINRNDDGIWKTYDLYDVQASSMLVKLN